MNHQASHGIAKRGATVVLEGLKVKAMTRLAKGTIESPDTNVKQKSGLNREILKTDWGQSVNCWTANVVGRSKSKRRIRVSGIMDVSILGQIIG